MNLKKYLIFNNYKNFVENFFLNIVFSMCTSLNKTIDVNGTKIIFVTNSKKEYFLRTEIAFISEKIIGYGFKVLKKEIVQRENLIAFNYFFSRY